MLSSVGYKNKFPDITEVLRTKQLSELTQHTRYEVILAGNP
jgi:hypothetical protein